MTIDPLTAIAVGYATKKIFFKKKENPNYTSNTTVSYTVINPTTTIVPTSSSPARVLISSNPTRVPITYNPTRVPTNSNPTKVPTSASVLTPEQVEEIRSLKNKVPAYMIVRDYHINKNRVSDIWDDSERLQQ
ncbi:265_t:CDS:2, partial [Funneliformis geosporum]